jgi:hypothetical protein
MKVVLKHENRMSLELDTSGFVLFGENISEREAEREIALSEQSAQDKIARVLYLSGPTTCAILNRDLLLKCLAEMDAHEFVRIDIYSQRDPIVFRNDEQFFIIAPAAEDAIQKVIDVRAAFGIKGGEK